jgi:hypothetical protein
MATRKLSHAVLVRESEVRMQAALRAEDLLERLVATRIFEDPRMWRRWETENNALMRDVAADGRAEVQLKELRTKSFQLIHRKAPFEYLRDEHVGGTVRRQFIRRLHPARSVTEGLITEHAAFLRSAASLICARHVGVAVAEDGVFEDPLARYEELYGEYFRAYCGATLGVAGDTEANAQRALLPYLKLQLEEQRRRLLRMPPLRPQLLVPARLRRPTGETQRLPQAWMFRRRRS